MIHQLPADGVTPPSDPGAFQPYTLPEAARRLGVGQSTIRRMVKAGKLRAETVLRPQGNAWVVWLPDTPSGPEVEGASEPPYLGGSARSTTLQDPPGPSAPDALAAWVVSLMAPLAEANARQHEMIERQAETIRDQAERLGSLTEQVGYREHELARSSVEIATLSNELHVVEVSRWRYARSLALAVAVLVVGAVVAGMLAAPVWVR